MPEPTPPRRPFATRARRLAAIAALTSSFFAPRVARANGRFPAAGQIAVDPADPAHLVVRTTYGLVTTRDAGATWSWICEGAMGLGGAQDPMTAIAAGGTLLVGAAEGLLVSRDGGCDWQHGPSGVGDHYCLDLATWPKDPARAVFLEYFAVGQSFTMQVWGTSDAAKTVAQLGSDLPDDFTGLTLELAPSDPARIYVSGRRGAPSYPGAMVRSTDGGATWETIDPPGLDPDHLPYIGAIDPHDADVVYVRVDGPTSDRLLVTNDGGATWTTALEAKGALLGFALADDGATVFAGGDQDGLLRASASDLAFHPVSSVGVRCLTAAAGGLYACADEAKDGFTVGLSKDAGATFAPVMHLDGLCGPLACPAGSAVAGTCPAAWDGLAATIDAKGCADPPDAGADAGDPPDAGDAGASATSTGAGGAGAAPRPDPGGCGCATPGRRDAPSRRSLVVLGLALAACTRARASRRRRARRATAS